MTENHPQQAGSVLARQPEAPWPPRTILLVGLLATFSAGGVLAGLNWARLGIPDRRWPVVYGSLLAGLILLSALLLGGLTTLNPVIIGAAVLLNSVLAAGIALWQRGVYRDWAAAHTAAAGERTEQSRSTLAIVALGVPLVFACMVTPCLVTFGLPALLNLLPYQTYETGVLTLEYGGIWRPVDIHGQAFCRAPAVDCLAGLRYWPGGVVVDVVRWPVEDDMNTLSAQELDTQLWIGVSVDQPGVLLDETTFLDVQGSPAVRWRYTQPFAGASNPSGVIFVNQTVFVRESFLYRVRAVAPDARTLLGQEDALAAMVESIRFDE